MTEPDNLVPVLLRELRADMDQRFAQADTRFDRLEKRLENVRQQPLANRCSDGTPPLRSKNALSGSTSCSPRSKSGAELVFMAGLRPAIHVLAGVEG